MVPIASGGETHSLYLRCMSKDIKTAKSLFHEALEALSLYVGDKTTTVAGYRLKHLNNGLVVSKDNGWVSIRSGISLWEFNTIMYMAGLTPIEDLVAMVKTLADYIHATNMPITYKANGATEESFVWANDNIVYIGSNRRETTLISKLSPMDFYGLMQQVGVCLVGYSDEPYNRVGKYAIVSNMAH